MKPIRFIGTLLAAGLILLISTSLCAQVKEDVRAQQKAAREKEMQAKKEMLEMQHQEMKEHEILMREKEIEFAEQSAIPPPRLSSGRVYVHSNGDEPIYIPFYDRGSQTQLTLRNSFNGGSDSSKGEFEVDEGIRQLRCMIRGKVREGEIFIKVLYPGGKVFKELTITSSAEVTFTQSLSIKEGSQDKYEGSWTYEVKAKEAKGDYTFSISTE